MFLNKYKFCRHPDVSTQDQDMFLCSVEGIHSHFIRMCRHRYLDWISSLYVLYLLYYKYKTQIRPPQILSLYPSSILPVVLMLSVGEEIWTSLRLMWPGNVLDFTQQPQWWADIMLSISLLECPSQAPALVEDKYWGKWQYFVALFTRAGKEPSRGLTVPGEAPY